MRSAERQPAPPGRQAIQGGMDRIRRFAAAAPLPVKVLLVIAAVVLLPVLVLAMLAYAPYALWTSDRSPLASAAVALWGIAITAAQAHGPDGPRYALLLLPVAVALLAHASVISRGFVPCRTTALSLVWSLPVGILTFRFWHGQPYAGPLVAWLIAAGVLAWRLARAMQQVRERSVATALAAPYAWSPPGAARRPARAARAPARAGRGRRRARRFGSRRRVTGCAASRARPAAPARRARRHRRSASRTRWPNWTRWSAWPR